MEGRVIALTERLALLVTLDAGGAIKGLENVGKAADRGLGKAESRIDRTAKGMQKAGVGMLGAAGLAATGLYKAGQSAADLEQAVGGTEAVFKEASGAIDAYAKNAATKMGLSERAFREATTSLGGQLKALGFDIDDAADKSIELTGIAADLAATYGGTTAEAVAALGAAFRGEADPAERFNLRLNQNTVNAKALELGLAESTSQVDAQAKAQATLALITEQSADAQGQFAREADSASGSMAIATAQFEDAKASLGQSVAPILADVAGGLSGLASGFSEANEASGGLLSKLAAYGTIGLGAAGGLSFVVGKAIELRGTLGKLAGPLRNAEGGLNKFGKAGVVAGTAVAAWSVGKMIEGATELKIDLDQLTTALGNMTAATQEQAEEAVRGLDAFGQLDDTVSDLADTNIAAAERLIDVAEAAGIQGDQLADLKAIVDDKRASDVQAAKDQQANTEALQAAVDPTGDLAGATGGLTGELDKQAGALEEVEKGLQAVYDATVQQFDSNLSYRKAIDSTEDSLADLVETQKEHGRNSEEYRDALLDAEGALYDQAAAAVKMAEDTALANGVTLDAQAKTAIHREELRKLAANLAPGSPLRRNLEAYIGSLKSIPSLIETKLQLSVSTSGAQFSAGAAINLYEQQLEGRAAGGPVMGGRPYIVGERGPELFVPNTAGSIVPNDGGARPAGGGDTIVIQVGDREVARLYADGKVRAGRRGFAA